LSEKLSQSQARAYWRGVHVATSDDLAAVCFPDKPAYFNAFFDRIQRHAVTRALKRCSVIPSGNSVLDIGCGRGRWLDYYAALGAVPTGLDLSPVAIASCMKRGYEAVAASATEMPFPDGAFDIVNCITVLLHLPPEAQERAVAEAARSLKPGGILLLIESTWKDPATHVFPRPLNDWLNLLEQHRAAAICAEAHCFNVCRKLLDRIPANPAGVRDALAIALDYPVEYALMAAFSGRASEFGMQHLIIARKG